MKLFQKSFRSGFSYDLGEMKGPEGESLRYEVEKVATDLAVKMSELLARDPFFKKILNILPSAKTMLHYQSILKSQIYMPVIRSCLEHQPLSPEQALCLLIRPSGAFKLLIKKMLRQFRGMFSPTSVEPKVGSSRIAIQYADGIDLSRRSDMVWFPGSGIDPSNVIIYFEEEPSADIIACLEKQGLKWTHLKPKTTSSGPISRQLSRLKPDSMLEHWVYETALALAGQAEVWSDFYRQYNIRVNFAMGEGSAAFIAQSLAFDLPGSTQGFLAGKQRSVMFLKSNATLVHYYKDVFFAWNRLSNEYLHPYSQIPVAVVAGYPGDISFPASKISAQLNAKRLKDSGVKFTAALFDNMHNPRCHISSKMMRDFYQSFLDWLLADKEVGLIIKSKKPKVLNELPEIADKLEKACATGRCLVLDNEFGRLPLDAAAAANISVGIGISSAVAEAVIAGFRGIHCDLTKLRTHEFYEWGEGSLVFDDLEKMMKKIKQFKADPSRCPDLGNWAPYLDRLDPFRDGRAGERMGTYLRWCLDGFDQGLMREEILRIANNKYAAQWGKDKIICEQL